MNCNKNSFVGNVLKENLIQLYGEQTEFESIEVKKITNIFNKIIERISDMIFGNKNHSELIDIIYKEAEKILQPKKYKKL